MVSLFSEHALQHLRFHHADHTKALLIRFSGERGMRVVVLTSNLEAASLYMFSQALWWQDFPCKVPAPCCAYPGVTDTQCVHTGCVVAPLV